MARSKSATTTPKAKKATIPQSAPAKRTVRTSPPDDAGDAIVSDADSAPADAAAASTPARKQPKRKAPLDEDAAAATASTTKNKKSRVSIHTEQSTVTSMTASGKKSTRKQRNVNIEIPVASTPRGKRIVFGDDDDAAATDDGPSEFFTPQEDKKTSGLLEGQLSADTVIKPDGAEVNEDSDGDADSDDEAPEAVSTSAAAAQAAKATQAAARAAELQREDERRKRQERDAKFKKQAEARKKQQDKKKEAAAAAAAATAQADSDSDNDDDDDDNAPNAAENTETSRLVTSLAAPSRTRLDRRALPSVLPDEFLESDDSDAEVDDDEVKRPKKITFNAAARQVAAAGDGSRHPADQRVGSTVYRVVKKQGEAKLAPRGGKYSKNAKEMMLGRGRVVPRTSVKKKSFLVR